MNTLPSARTNRMADQGATGLSRLPGSGPRSPEEDFAEFVGARWGSLYRLAYLLAASPTGAEDLLQTTLEKAYVDWGRISRMEHAEAHVRRMLAKTLVSGPRPARNRAQPWDELPETAGDVAESLDVDHLLWPLVCALPDRQRAVIVLRCYEDLSEAQIAEVLGCPPGTVKSQSWAAIGALRRALAASGIGEGARAVMSLDSQLRTALDHQVDLRYAPPPDVHGLIHGGRARRRRRTATRAGVGVVAVALVLGGAYGVTQIDGGRNHTDSAPAAVMTLPSFQDTEFVPIKPGKYRMAVGADAHHARIEAELTVRGPGWLSGTQPVVSEVSGAGAGSIMAGVGVYQPRLLAGGTGCTGSWRGRAPGATPLEMARQLTRLPRSEVVQRPTVVRAFGHDALHLRLRINDHCPMDEYYRLAETSSGDRGISYADEPQVVDIDLWVVDVDGTAVVVDMWHHTDTLSALLETTNVTRSSVRFETLK